MRNAREGAHPTYARSTVVNSGQQLVLGAGPHGALTLNPHATLHLAGGDHQFTSLTINPSATVLVYTDTRIFVVGGLGLRSPFLLEGQSSTLAAIFLGLASSSNIAIETAFDGTLLAPNATVSFGLGSGLTYRGLFYARSIEIRPDTIMLCAATIVPQ